MLVSLRDEKGAAEAVARHWPLLKELFPLCRSITGNGVRQTLDRIGEVISLDRVEVPSGTPVLDWEVPPEWNIADAYVARSDGTRVVDFRASTLHVMSYSVPVRQRMTRDELEPHLHSLPERPDWIPYRTSYYRERWGFCMSHRDRERLGEGPFDVVINSTLAPGHLTYAECVVPGSASGEAIVYTHTCHPSLANDNLSGMVAATILADAMRADRPHLTWRFVFGPGTIGSLTWLARNEQRLGAVRGGLTIGLLGDPGALTYKRSRKGATATDRVAEYVLPRIAPSAQLVDFEPYGYDERQFCSPGFDLAIGRITRSANGQYAEYHTSADNLQFIQPWALAESVRAIAGVISVADRNRALVNLSPKGEPRLGKRGLYGDVGGQAPAAFEHALLWVLSFSDGAHDLVEIARRSGLEFDLIDAAASALQAAGLARVATQPVGE